MNLELKNVTPCNASSYTTASSLLSLIILLKPRIVDFVNLSVLSPGRNNTVCEKSLLKL